MIRFSGQDITLLQALGFMVDIGPGTATTADTKVELCISPSRHDGDFELTITLPDGTEVTGDTMVRYIQPEDQSKMQIVDNWMRHRASAAG